MSAQQPSPKTSKNKNGGRVQTPAPLPPPFGPGQAEGRSAIPAQQYRELEALTLKVCKGDFQMTCLLRKSFAVAHTVGQHLLQIKQVLQGREDSWLQWLENHCSLTADQAHKYMQLVSVWDDLKDEGHDPAHLGIDENLALLAPWETPPGLARRPLPIEAERLRHPLNGSAASRPVS